MTLSAWFLYAVVAAVAVVSPGPATLLAINNSILGGRRVALISTLGSITGIGVLSVFATIGLGALLQASAPLFNALKVTGALYLVYLGLQQWRGSIPVASGTTAIIKRSSGVFVRGLLISVSNPKSILFFTALFPQFIDHQRPVASQFVLMTITFMLFSLTSLTVYATLAGRMRQWMSSSQGQRLFQRICGSLFVAMGTALLTSVGRASART
ncbi:LysE family transporter [bacterium]|nr:LysE family transporter [bacterium]